MTTRIVFVGDTLLGGTADDVLDDYGDGYPLSGIQHLWADADLVVANQEGPLTRRTVAEDKADTGKKRFWYKGTPESAYALAAAGIDLVSLANNHVCDYGVAGLADTIAALDAAGVRHCGAGADAREARRPAIVEIGGLRIGFLSVMQRYEMYRNEVMYAGRDRPGAALLQPQRIAASLARLRASTDLCVVLVHWGRNYKPLTGLQQRLAADLAGAGAHLIVGHHPHIPHPVSEIGGVPVLYSLGNGALGTPGRFHSGRPPYGLIARVDVAAGRVVDIDIKVIVVDNSIIGYRPMPAVAADEQALLASLSNSLSATA